MPTTKEVLEFIIPQWAVCALINGDLSGLDDQDIEKLKSFTDKTIKKYGNADFMLGEESENSYFRWSNDILNEGDNVIKLYLFQS